MIDAPSGPAPRHGQLPCRARERVGRALSAAQATSRGYAMVLVMIAVIGAWVATYLAGGTQSALTQMFYLPIVFAAVRFRWPGAVATALASGALAGPLMPLEVNLGAAQPAAASASRLVAFVSIGVLVAWLTGESDRSIVAFTCDARGARALRRALDLGELEAHYQPIVDLDTGRVIGFEALCRWRDPTRGLVPPSEFIPLAERTGVIIALGAFMLEQGARQAVTWNSGGTRALVMAVNVSANQLCHPGFTTQVRTVLRETGLHPHQLCLEITETAIIHDRNTALAHIVTLRDLGVLISVDDFGTGQASLTYLRDFPVDIVKIDLSFVRTIDTDPTSAALVAGIITLAHGLGASTIAEGIERRTQLHTLRTLGCTHAQGYYLGRPGPPPDTDTLRLTLHVPEVTSLPPAHRDVPHPRTGPTPQPGHLHDPDPSRRTRG